LASRQEGGQSHVRATIIGVILDKGLRLFHCGIQFARSNQRIHEQRPAFEILWRALELRSQAVRCVGKPMPASKRPGFGEDCARGLIRNPKRGQTREAPERKPAYKHRLQFRASGDEPGHPQTGAGAKRNQGTQSVKCLDHAPLGHDQ